MKAIVLCIRGAAALGSDLIPRQLGTLSYIESEHMFKSPATKMITCILASPIRDARKGCIVNTCQWRCWKGEGMSPGSEGE